MMNSNMTKALRNPIQKLHTMMTSILPVLAHTRLKNICSSRSVSSKVFGVAMVRIFGTMG